MTSQRTARLINIHDGSTHDGDYGGMTAAYHGAAYLIVWPGVRCGEEPRYGSKALSPWVSLFGCGIRRSSGSGD
jgi:hypothetical protein